MPENPFMLPRVQSWLLPVCLFALAAGSGMATAAQAPAGVSKSGSAAPSAPSAIAPADAKPPVAPDPRAREALGKAVRFHREARDLSLVFKASVYNAALDKQEGYEGKLLLKGASRFRLEIPGGTYVSDGETYWEYHPGTGQAVMRRAKEMEDKPLPGDILLRFLDSDPLSLAETVADGRRYLELRLDPSRAMKNLDSLAVLLDEKDFSLHRISSRDVSGNEAEYTVVKVKRNGGIKDKAFTFVPPKGAEVVDMRDE